MKSEIPGTSTSVIEVVQIDSHGFWLHIKGMEYFLSYDLFPWFREAKINEILNVELLHGQHLYWPELDVDLSMDILSNTEKYKLTYHL
jgi:hypothetical protein